MKQLSILAIDDDKEILYALDAIFETQQWGIYRAQSVEQGLELLVQHTPDLVVIDYHMPRINGLEGVRRIRRVDSEVPIIVFTVEESQQVADRFLEAGANDFALKPIKAPDLISRIRVHLRLMESKRKQYPEPEERVFLRKGIRQETLSLIEEMLGKEQEFLAVEQIALKTGLADQTTYRYLQYMTDKGMLEIKTSYGKVGRPRQFYKLKKTGNEQGQ